MSSSYPAQLHIFNKNDYSSHALVTLPSASSNDLAPSSIRIQSKILGQTTNNLTYARMGHILGWWGIYEQPPNTPEPYNDTSTYTTVPAWGYAEILASNVSGIETGQTVYGFVPTGTLPFDVQVEKTEYKDQIFVTNPERQALWKIYNRLKLHAPLTHLTSEKGEKSLGYDALMWGLFGTGYNMNRYAFAWVDAARIHPSGNGVWGAADSDLTGATVVLLSASGKTAMSFGWALRNDRPKDKQPKKVVAVCSGASQRVCEAASFYDEVKLYDDIEAAKALAQAQEQKKERIVLVDFGARGTASKDWDSALSPAEGEAQYAYTFVMVGAEVKPQNPEATSQLMMTRMQNIIVNASLLREKGIENEGDIYFEQFGETFERFKDEGGIPGLKMEWREGMEGWETGWQDFCEDKIAADTGVVVRL